MLQKYFLANFMQNNQIYNFSDQKKILFEPTVRRAKMEV